MPTKLKNLVITKVALVDEGSCSAAHIKLFKRKEGGNVMKTLEEILKSLPEDQKAVVEAEIAKAKKDAADEAKAELEDELDGGIDDAMENPDGTPKADTKKKSVAKVAAKVKELKAEIAKMKDDKSGSSEEEILKAASPEVRAILEKARAREVAAQAAIIKMKEEADQAESIAKAKEVSHLPVKAEDLAKSLKALKNTNETVFNDVFAVLKAADAMLADGNVTGEQGTTGAADEETFAKAADAAWVEIEKKAEEIKKSANCTKEVAISKAISENPKLYQNYLDNLK